ncbi:3-oxoacyl-[acyl-carrier-protein] reductase FabG-like [Maniola hyperantus]|uniref:3-oxoacyl-[acyl-carrier-protein] reductase FabG-like n=1 Tax=Aphantopus hyperantus TaxID=2795564 RepID=UPI0015683701|nr:3-oxoacyl-[acyl-carrier-protein] reductase FabG-like [Maniola hyperantus]
MGFKNKVVIVTGASSGIGAAIAVAFSSQGAKVVIVGRNEVKLGKVHDQCSSDTLAILADVAKDEDVRRIVELTIKKFGQIDILVNNAGLGRVASLHDSNIMEAYDTIMNVNVRGLIHLTSLAAPHLAKTKGNIVNISSVSALMTPSIPGMINYYVSKAAVSHFGRCAAAELAPLGIRVNTVSPGPVKTDFLDNADMNFSWDKASKQTCLNRVSEPEEIADLVLFVASDKARGITGSDFLSDDGILIKRE